MASSKKNSRNIDRDVSRAVKDIKKSYVFLPSADIQAWKAYLIITFIGGFFAALVWSAYNQWYVASEAYLEPSSDVVMYTYEPGNIHKAGEQFTSQIVLDTAGKNIVAAQAVGSFDVTKFSIMEIDFKNTSFQFQVSKSFDNSTGVFFITLGKPTPGVNSSQAIVADVIVQSHADFEGAALKLKLDSFAAINDSAAILDDKLGTNVLSRVTQGFASYTPQDKDPDPIPAVPAPRLIQARYALACSDKLIQLEWFENSLSSNSIVTVERKRKRDDSFGEIGRLAPGVGFFSDTDVKKATYYYQICYQKDQGAKICTDVLKVKKYNKSKIQRPRIVTDNMPGNIKLTWIPRFSEDFEISVMRKNPGAKYYFVLNKMDGGTVNYFEDKTVESGKKYSYKLKIKAKGKLTRYSNTVRLTAK